MNRSGFPHEDMDLFKEAVLYTSGQTGFSAALIEKDYYCSLVLEFLYKDKDSALIFKGGTSLSKIYSGFYRLSEDLDFVIPVSSGVKRSERRRKIKPLKAILPSIDDAIPGMKIEKELSGFNNSTQYIAHANYQSIVGAASKNSLVKIEIGLREPLLEKAQAVEAKTLLTNPFLNKPCYSPIRLNAMSLTEAFAEKFRAALTRRTPAIRDFYDIYHAVENKILDQNDHKLIKLIDEKLKIPGNSGINLDSSRKQELEKQLKTELKPVLRSADYNNFNLSTAFKIAENMAGKLV